MLHLKLLGGAALKDETGVLGGPASRRHSLALLALLATAPSRRLSRGKVIGYLWPDIPEKGARTRLNTLLYRLRREVGDEVLVSVGDDLWLNDRAVDCDIFRFEEAVQAGEHARAVRLYAGPFLDGFERGGSEFFERRVDSERARLRSAYWRSLEALAFEAEKQGDLEGAARWWRVRVNQDPYDSAVTKRLMEALARAGKGAAALRAAHSHARLLEREFGTEPSREVRAFAEELRAPSVSGALFPPEPSAVGPRPSAGRAPRPARTTRRLDRRALLIPVVVVGLLGAGTIGGWVLLGAGASLPGISDRAIAVLPFENLANEPASALAEGLHSDLLTRLSRVQDLDVVSRASVGGFREAETPLREVARELGARWLVLGEVQRSGDELQMNARLVDARRDRQVWAEGYRRAWAAEDLFQVQAEIAEAIVRSLAVELSPAEKRRLRTVPTQDMVAYELYQQARVPDRSSDVRESYDRRVGLYRRALEMDPGFAEAWAGLADIHVLGSWSFDDLTLADSAAAAVRKALELDPDLADAHAQLGDLHWRLGRTEEAIGAYEVALELEPSHPQATNNLLSLLAFRGRLAERMKWLDRARRLSPGSSRPIRGLMHLNAQLDRDEVAEAWLEYGRRRGHAMPWWEFVVVLFHRGDLERAREILDRLSQDGEEDFRLTRRRAALALYEEDWTAARRWYRALYPGVRRGTAPVFGGLLWDPLGLAYSLDRLGEWEEAREIAGEVVRAAQGSLAARPEHDALQRLTVGHLILGDTAAALDRLERSVDAGYRDVRVMRTLPVLDPLRANPRFQALLERMEILVAEQRRRVETEGWGLPPGS